MKRILILALSLLATIATAQEQLDPLYAVICVDASITNDIPNVTNKLKNVAYHLYGYSITNAVNDKAAMDKWSEFQHVRISNTNKYVWCFEQPAIEFARGIQGDWFNDTFLSNIRAKIDNNPKAVAFKCSKSERVARKAIDGVMRTPRGGGI